VLNFFDVVAVTRYGLPQFIVSNEKEIAIIEGIVDPSRLRISPSVVSHTPRDRRGTGGVCARGSGETVSVYKDRVYPCCMGWGIGTSESVPISTSWESDVMRLSRPCKDCFFS
jgi:hypothetical protein